MEIIHSKKLSFNRESGESQLHILIVLRKTNINSTDAKNFFNDNNSIKLQCISQETSFNYPKGPDDIFFLSILMVGGEATSMRREAPREKNSLFQNRYVEKGPLEPR